MAKAYLLIYRRIILLVLSITCQSNTPNIMWRLRIVCSANGQKFKDKQNIDILTLWLTRQYTDAASIIFMSSTDVDVEA